MSAQYYLYDSETFKYAGTNFYDEQPINSVDFAPQVETEFAKVDLDKNVWVDCRSEEEIIKSQVPESVSTMRFWLAVYELLGITEQQVLSNVDKIQDTSIKIKIQIMLNKAQEFDKSNQMLNYMANELGISQQQLDEIFINASKLDI